MGWTQPVCDRCFGELHPGQVAGRMREPYREDETCCWCGVQTRSGIYVRIDPATVDYPSTRDD